MLLIAPDRTDRTDRRRPGPHASARLVLLGGIPGAGKTTSLDRLRSGSPDIRTIDPERLRERIGARLGGAVPYRAYRGVVHGLNAVHVLAVLLRGPTPTDRPLVLHDPATRPVRRWVTGRVARWRGWDPVLLFLDVAREDAVAGQQRRGRVVRAAPFEAHWRRWRRQRPRLLELSRSGRPAGPWSRVHVVDREHAAEALAAALTRG